MDNGDAKHSCEKIAFQYFYSDAPHIISVSLARLRDMVADRFLCRALVIRLVTRADHASDKNACVAHASCRVEIDHSETTPDSCSAGVSASARIIAPLLSGTELPTRLGL